MTHVDGIIESCRAEGLLDQGLIVCSSVGICLCIEDEVNVSRVSSSGFETGIRGGEGSNQVSATG